MSKRSAVEHMADIRQRLDESWRDSAPWAAMAVPAAAGTIGTAFGGPIGGWVGAILGGLLVAWGMGIDAQHEQEALKLLREFRSFAERLAAWLKTNGLTLDPDNRGYKSTYAEKMMVYVIAGMSKDGERATMLVTVSESDTGSVYYKVSASWPQVGSTGNYEHVFDTQDELFQAMDGIIKTSGKFSKPVPASSSVPTMDHGDVGLDFWRDYPGDHDGR